MEAIKKAMSKELRDSIQDMTGPYGKGNTSDKIVSISLDFILNNKFDLRKSFYEL